MSKKNKMKIMPVSPQVREQAAAANTSTWLISPVWAVGLMVFTGLLIYSNSYDCSFHFDDDYNIIKNEVIRKGVDLKAIWQFTHNRFWPFVSFALNYSLGEYSVWGYHVFNVVIHLVNTLLVYCLGILVFSTPALSGNRLAEQKKNIAFCMAMLFVAHPLATQSVTYIVQRLASMAAMFYMASVACYIKGRLAHTKPKIVWLLSAGICALFAFTSKENAYTLPLAILLVEFTLLQHFGTTRILNKRTLLLAVGLMLLFICAVAAYFPSTIFNPILPAHGNTYTITSSNYFFTQFRVLIKYIELLFFPVHLNLDYDFPIAHSLLNLPTLLSLGGLLVLLIWASMQYSRRPIITCCVFWFFITLAVESSIVPIEDVIFEHRTYLPSFGFVCLLSFSAFAMLERYGKRVPLITLMILSLVYAILAHQRNNVWKTELSLFTDVVEKSPNKPRGWGSRADYYKETGNYQLALQDYNRAIQLNPMYSTALHNRAAIYEKLNKNELAMQDYNQALRANPEYFQAYANRGRLFTEMNQYEQAIPDLNRAIAIKPDAEGVYISLSIAYRRTGHSQQAIEAADNAIRLNPKFADAYISRGVSRMDLQETTEALLDFTKAIECNPKSAEAYYNRAIIYKQRNQSNKAMDDYTRAIALNPNYIQAYVNRSVIYMENNEWQKALLDIKQALRIDPAFPVALQNLTYIRNKSGLQ